MARQAGRWLSEWWRSVRAARVLTGLGCLGLAAASGGAAQVGYLPIASPYHDTPRGSAFVFGLGYLSGSRGVVGVGPSDGGVFSASYEHPFSQTLGVSFGLSDVRATRFLVNPTADSLIRTSGPIHNNVVLVNLGVQMVLTGGKTWHGLAPVVGGSLGIAVGDHISQDSSDYRFDTKVIFGPEAGVRWYWSRQLSLRLSLRVLWWRLGYPLQFQTPAADGSRVLAVNAATTEWTQHPCATLGVGWIF